MEFQNYFFFYNISLNYLKRFVELWFHIDDNTHIEDSELIINLKALYFLLWYILPVPNGAVSPTCLA